MESAGKVEEKSRVIVFLGRCSKKILLKVVMIKNYKSNEKMKTLKCNASGFVRTNSNFSFVQFSENWEEASCIYLHRGSRAPSKHHKITPIIQDVINFPAIPG